MGNLPIDDSDIFAEDIAIAGGFQLRWRGGENIGIGDDDGRLAAGIGNFEIVLEICPKRGNLIFSRLPLFHTKKKAANPHNR